MEICNTEGWIVYGLKKLFMTPHLEVWNVWKASFESKEESRERPLFLKCEREIYVYPDASPIFDWWKFVNIW